MAIQIPVTVSDEIISFEEFYRRCDETLKLADEASLASMAEALAALARNRSAFASFFNSELIEVLDKGKSMRGGRNTEQAFIIARKNNYVLRLAVWDVPKVRGGSVQWDNEYYVYGQAHNHTFSLLTVGLFGPGYITENYSLETGPCLLTPGADIALKRHPDQKLSEGTVLLYRKWNDIHIQHPPEAFTASLNLIVEDTKVPQYMFDVKNSKVGTQIAGPFVDLSRIIKISDAYDPSLRQGIAPDLVMAESIEGTYLEHQLKAAGAVNLSPLG